MNAPGVNCFKVLSAILIMVCGCAFAQPLTKLDSLEQKVASSSGLEKCALAVEMFRAFEAQPDVGNIPIPTKYGGYFDECIAIAESKGSWSVLNPLRIYRSAIFVRGGQQAKVIELLTQVISSGYPLDPEDSLSTYAYISAAYMRLELYDKALETAKIKYRVAESIGRTDVVADKNSEIAGVYYRLKVYDLATRYYLKCVEEHKTLKNFYVVASNYNNVGLCYMRANKLDTALAYFDTAILNVNSHYTNIDDKSGEAAFLELLNGNKATVFYNQGKYDKAIAIQEKNIKPDSLAEDKMGTLNAILLLSNAYRRKNEPETAIKYIDMAEALVKQYNMNSLSSSIQIGEIKARVLLDLGEYEKSARIFKTINHLKDSIRSEQNRKMALASNSGYQVYQKENELIKQKASLAESEADRLEAEQERRLFLFIAIILLSAAVLVFVLFKQKAKSNKILASQKQEIEDQTMVIESNLEEKETLLKEIQHRVKNNLQVISGMLQLQTKNFDDPKMQEAMEEAQGRIKSMAIIHQQLYLSENNINYISFDKYLKNLTGQIAGAYRQISRKVTIDIDVHNIEFNVDTAVPLGIIVNELVSNAFKYAFHETEAGSIAISIDKEGDNDYKMSIKDNGIGLPDDFDPMKTKSLGLKLVKILSKQMKGTFAFNSDSGTHFTISFKDNVAV